MEAGVGAEGVPPEPDVKTSKQTGALIVCLFKPRERLILLAEPDANHRKLASRRVVVTAQLLEVVENFKRLLSLPCQPTGPAKKAFRLCVTSARRPRLPGYGHGVLHWVGIRYGDSNLQGFEVVKRCLHWLR